MINKNNLYALTFCLFCLIIPALFSPASAGAAQWTHLVFLNDSASAAQREINELELIADNGFIDCYVLWYDNKAGVKKTFHLKKDIDASKINSPVIETSKISTSSDVADEFSSFALKYSPIKNKGALILTFYDRESSLAENGSYIPKNQINIKKLSKSFAKISAATQKPVEVAHFDANNFQCLELLYELAPYVSNVIGSEERIPAYATPYAGILAPIIEQKIDSAQRFCFLFVSEWGKYYKQYQKGSVKATLSAYKTAEVPMVTEKLNIFLEAVAEDLKKDEFKNIFLGSIIKNVRRYSGGKFVDAFDLGRLVNEEINEEISEQASREFLASLTNATIKNSAIGDYGKIPGSYNSFGISVFMPIPAPKFEGYTGLEFAKSTGWIKFLEFFYSFSIQRPW